MGNLDRVRAVYDEWAKGNLRAGTDLWDEYVVLVIRPEFSDSGMHAGPDGIRAYMRSFLEPFEGVTIEAEDFTEAGDTIVVDVRQHGTGKLSGAPVDVRYAQVWSFRGGKVIRIESVMDSADARRVAGVADG